MIRRAREGDRQAIALIYEMYVDRIYRYVGYRITSDIDVEDVVAQVFVRMVEGLSKYRLTGAPFEAWLYRIAAARIADFYREHKRGENVELTESLAGDEPLPETRLVESQEKDDLIGAVQQLSEDEQTVLVLRFVERRSHKDVADIMGRTVAAVKSIQHRGLIRLASLLGSDDKVRHYLRGDDG